MSAVGHTVPRDGLKTGQQVAAGEIIAAVAGFPGQKTNLPPHVHLTFAWVPKDFRLDQLTWKNLGHDPGITLIDPLSSYLSPDRLIGARAPSKRRYMVRKTHPTFPASGSG